MLQGFFQKEGRVDGGRGGEGGGGQGGGLFESSKQRRSSE